MQTRTSSTGRTTGRTTLPAAAWAFVALVLLLAGCGPKSLQEFVAQPTVGYAPKCAEKTAAQKKAVDELRYFPNTLHVKRWPKELPGGKEATLTDEELVRRMVKGEVKHLLVSARGGVGKSTLARAIEAMACGQALVFRIDLNADVAARLAAGGEGNAVLAAIERQVGVDRDVDRRQSFRELFAAAQTWLLFDAIEEVPLADRPKVVAQISALSQQLPNARWAVFARPAVFEKDYGLAGIDGEVALPTLECSQAKSVLRWNAPDKDHQARADNFVRTYRLDKQTTRRDRCTFPYMAAYRDLEVVARMAEKFEPKDDAEGLSATLAEVHETIVGERLRKELAALNWSPAQILQAIDGMVRVDGRDDGSWNLVFTVPRCLEATAKLAEGEVARKYVCEKMLQSALFDRIEGAEEWRFDHQSVADLFLARWLDREITRFQGDCEVVDKHAGWIGQRDIAGYRVGQPAGRRCLPQVAAVMCAAHEETFERGLGDLLYKGLPMTAERRTLVSDATKAVSRWKKATPCVKKLIESL